MTVVVDASVALKWVIQEDGSEAAVDLIRSDTLAAPDLLFVECANVLWAKARRLQITPGQARAAFDAIDATPIRVVPVRPHAAAAQAIALDLGQTAYDSLYLAAAMAERATLVTADQEFATAARRHPVYGPSVRLLGD